MIPLHLEVTNFLAYRNPAPLDFAGIHVAVLAGENGAGKSSLLDAITWALWGRARCKSDAELVHQGQTEMRVAFSFSLGGQNYCVIRSRRAGSRGGSTLDFQIQGESGGWTSIAEATIPKTQEKITRLLRLTYDTFINSAYLVQGQADEFTSKRPTERKQVLADILGLQEWERYEERAKEKIKVLDLRLAGLDSTLREIDAELDRRAEYERELTQAQARLIAVAEQLRQAEAGWAEVDLARQQLVLLEGQLADLARRVRQAEKELGEVEAEQREARLRADTAAIYAEQETGQRQLAELDELEAEKERVTVARQTAADLESRLTGQNQAAGGEADVVKKRLAALAAATEPRCPTCQQPLAEDARQALVDQLQAELDARRSQYRENVAQLKSLADQRTAFDRALSQHTARLRGRAGLIRRLTELQAAVEKADEARERLPGLDERRTRWQDTLLADRAQQALLTSQTATVRLALADQEARQKALDRLRQEDTLAKRNLGAAQQKLDALDGLARQRALKRADRQRLGDERGLYDELKEAFGKRGVPALMIEAAVPEIEAGANVLLARMTGGRMHLRINMQRETQAGELRETLDIQIGDELGTRSYDLFSGGEQFRVNFAIRVALSQLLARRAGIQLQTLILDEGFGVLDAAGRDRLVEAINAVSNDFERILVVTHIDELKDAFPVRIEVTKTPDGSEIAVR